jgi:hypothetical protein
MDYLYGEGAAQVRAVTSRLSRRPPGEESLIVAAAQRWR